MTENAKKGNEAFAKRNWNEAIKFYIKADEA